MKVKKFFSSVGIACGYFGIYLMGQFAVMYAAMFYWGIQLSLRSVASGNGALTYEDLMQKFLAMVNDNAILLTLLSGIVSLALLLFSFVVRRRNFFHGVECYKVAPRSFLIPAALGVTCYVLANYILTFIPFPDAWMESYLTSSSLISSGNPVVEFLATVLMVPILEEIVFRGLFYTRLRRVMPKWVAALIASCLFGVMHGTIVWFIYTFLLSMVMIYIFEKYGSLLTNICLHAVFNLCGTISGFLPESLWQSFDALPTAVHIAIASVALLLTAGMMFSIRKMKKPSDRAVSAGEEVTSVM